MYAYDPLSQEQLFVPEFRDKYDEIREANRKRERRLGFIALLTLAILVYLLLMFVASR